MGRPSLPTLPLLPPLPVDPPPLPYPKRVPKPEGTRFRSPTARFRTGRDSGNQCSGSSGDSFRKQAIQEFARFRKLPDSGTTGGGSKGWGCGVCGVCGVGVGWGGVGGVGGGDRVSCPGRFRKVLRFPYPRVLQLPDESAFFWFPGTVVSSFPLFLESAISSFPNLRFFGFPNYVFSSFSCRTRC